MSPVVARFGDALVMIGAFLAVLALGEAASLLSLDLKTQIAPAITVAGVIAAVRLFYLKERSDRRRKTLEAYERQLYDKELRGAIAVMVTALRLGTYEADEQPDQAGSLRDQTSFIINYVECCCEGAVQRLYDVKMVHDLLQPLAQLLIEEFLTDSPEKPARTKRFLEYVERLSGIRAIFPDEFAKARLAALRPGVKQPSQV